PTIKDIIHLKANDELLLDSEIHWYVNGEEISERSNNTMFFYYELKKGDVIQAIVVKENKKFPSNEIIIANSPPMIKRAIMKPESPHVGSVLEVDAEAYDPDGDEVSFDYKWFINDSLFGEESSIYEGFKRGDKISVEVIPKDGDSYGKSVTLSKIIENAPPIVIEGRGGVNGEFYEYHINAHDPDGDELVYKLEEAPEDMTIDKDGVIKWKIDQDDYGTHNIKVNISDGHGGYVLYAIDVNINPPVTP
ncbi:MAG: hypothetical protein D6828_01480, partial [Nitrospirae bacterium]